MKNREKAVLVLEPENPEEVVMKMKKTGIRTCSTSFLNQQVNKISKMDRKFS